jgi:hypothetical protein
MVAPKSSMILSIFIGTISNLLVLLLRINAPYAENLIVVIHKEA